MRGRGPHGEGGEAPGGLPGSLEAEAGDVEAAGRRALRCRLDLLDLVSCTRAVEEVVDGLGPVEVLVNSGIYYGGGIAPFAETPIEEYQRAFTANVIAPLPSCNRCSRPCAAWVADSS